MVDRPLEAKLANLRISLDQTRNLTAAAIRETANPQLAQLTAHLGLCVRVLNEIESGDLNINKHPSPSSGDESDGILDEVTSGKTAVSGQYA